MNIVNDIKNMVDSAYERVIEGEGIYSDFADEGIEISPEDLGKFLDAIPNKKLKKWMKEMRKKTLRDVLTNSPDDYMVDVSGDCLTWKNSEVEDWQMQFFCEKIVKLYKKNNEILSPIKAFFKATPDTALERYHKQNPTNSVEEYCFLLLSELRNEEFLPFAWDELSPERQEDFLRNWIDKLNNVY